MVCGRSAAVCLVCIDLVVVDVWVSGFLVPSHYLVSVICYLVLSPLLPISTSTLTLLLLTLTPSLLLMLSRWLLKIGDRWGC